MVVLTRYAATLKRLRVDRVEAVATSAVREAANGKGFVRRVRSSLGIPLRIISGREEARLISLGVLRASSSRRPTAVISIGGGSVQVMIGEGGPLRYAASLTLGCTRLAQRFIRHDPPRPEEVKAMTRDVRRRLAPVARAMRRYRWRQTLGSSSTIGQLVRAAAAGIDAPLSHSSLQRLVRWLSVSTADERLRLPGLDPKREALILPTGVVLLSWMELCGVSRLRYAPGSLREGLMMDSVTRMKAPGLRGLTRPSRVLH